MTSSLPSGQTSVLLQMTQRLALSDAHFRRICQLIYQRAGIVLADHKRDMVYNRWSVGCVPWDWMILAVISVCWRLIKTALSGRLLSTL